MSLFKINRRRVYFQQIKQRLVYQFTISPNNDWLKTKKKSSINSQLVENPKL